MLDIVAFYPRPARPTARAITALSDELFLRSMRDPVAPLYTSKYRMRSTFLQTLHPDIELDDEHATVLRCVLMKPEQQRYIPVFHREIEKLALMIREEKLPA